MKRETKRTAVTTCGRASRVHLSLPYILASLPNRDGEGPTNRDSVGNLSSRSRQAITAERIQLLRQIWLLLS